MEIILVNDGSTDNSGNICDNFAKKDSRIKVIHKTNGGLSSARNVGITNAIGEYITFIDSDDYIETNFIEQLLYGVIESDCEICVCKLSSSLPLQHKINKSLKLYTSERAIKQILLDKKLTTSACGKLFCHELFKDIRFPEGRIFEDFATIYKVFNIASKICFIDTKKYFYRYNPKSITKSPFKNNQMQYFIAADEFISFLQGKYPHLVRYALHHSTRNAIAYIRRISMSCFKDNKTIDFLTTHIKKHIWKYLFSSFSIYSKLYGIFICISPKNALRFFEVKK